MSNIVALPGVWHLDGELVQKASTKQTAGAHYFALADLLQSAKSHSIYNPHFIRSCLLQSCRFTGLCFGHITSAPVLSRLLAARVLPQDKQYLQVAC